jgi:hypothetical protein
MKHLLNDLTEQEKNSIREQHTGGMNVVTENFSKLLNTKSGDVKPFVNEDESSIDCEKFMKDMKRSFNNTKDEFDFYYMNNNEWDRMSPRTASEFLESKLNKIINSAQREGCENIEELENAKNEYLNFWKKY